MAVQKPDTQRIAAAILVSILIPSLTASLMSAASAPSAQDDQFIIAMLSDVHISQGSGMSLLHSLLGGDDGADPLATVNSAVQEISALHPDMVVVCGDLVLDARASRPADARAAFQLFNQSMTPIILAGIPFYPVLGNHDVSGVLNAGVNGTESGYGRGAFLDSFRLSSSYYSFDLGSYHFVVLDPNSYELWSASSGGSRYRIDGEQMAWLHRDLNATTRPAIVFLHEPTVDLINRQELLDALSVHDVLMIFSGHWHINDLISQGAIAEQVTSALCGSWWTGEDLSAEPGGYRIIACNGSNVDSFYRYACQSRQINIVEPDPPLIQGSLNITAQIWSDRPVEAVRLSLDGNLTQEMNLTRQGLWYEAKKTVNLAGLPRGYHRAEVTAQDEQGHFSRELSFKISDETALSISEIISHRQTYLGKHITIRGRIEDYCDLSLIDEGMQPVLRDGTGSIPLVLKGCPALPEDSSTQWLAEGQLQRYSLKGMYSGMLLRADGLCPQPPSATQATFLSSPE